MLKINLPVQPVDLSQMLFQHNSHIIDMELADRYGCCLVVGSFREINDERERFGLETVKEPRPSEVGTSDYTGNYQDVTLGLHHRKAAFLSSFIHPYRDKYFSGRVKFDLFIKGINAEDKVLVIRRTGLVPQNWVEMPQLKDEMLPTAKGKVKLSDSSTEKKSSRADLSNFIKQCVKQSDDLFKTTGKAFSGAIVAFIVLACVGSFINKDQPRLTEQEKVPISNGLADAIQHKKELPDLRTQKERIVKPSNNDVTPELQKKNG
ncbi:hypothetical protein F0267_00190 [Vibrio coralliilyticus]|uniref:Uncharacterized protein n=2 Tax=Vibrio TaxID=662 RepID=A0AAN0W111_9VIBR|nr:MULTISPECIES: hypothetical protein [Vibrio]CAH1582421.1 conserved hypothetical protein [Vibrio jasicida]AIW22538.1 hypothetical protein IX92_26100 [Vibrio coralliilyticus]MCZ2802056.1 hypothetical protein [Vibrio alginolyticus]NOH36637.1 hypothetical protein [Vibrio coralliilyticus]CAH1590884.1 conserved hypothetical protein [Vibrio jasicida]